MEKALTLFEKKNSLRDFLVRNKQSITEAIPSFMSTERLIGQLFTTINTNPALLDATPRSLIGALLYAGSLGLEPGPLGLLYLIPFKNKNKQTVEVTVIPGYKGLVQLARRSGQVARINTGVVWEGDEFEFEVGPNAYLRHKPNPEREDFGAFKEVQWVYAYYSLKGIDGIELCVMSRNNIEWHRKKYSKAAQSGPWVDVWDQMSMKTALRKLLKLAPMATDTQSVIVMDELAETQMSQEGLLPDMPEEIDKQLQENEQSVPVQEEEGSRVPMWAAQSVKGKLLTELTQTQLKGLSNVLKKRTEGSEEGNPMKQEELTLKEEVDALLGKPDEKLQAVHKPTPATKPEIKEDAEDQNIPKAQALMSALKKLPGGNLECLDVLDNLRIVDDRLNTVSPEDLRILVESLMLRIQHINDSLAQEESTK